MYLDLDDTTSYGPETVTVSLKEEYLKSGEFKYSVHNYTNRGSSNSSALSSSNAVVHIYKGNELLKILKIVEVLYGMCLI